MCCSFFLMKFEKQQNYVGSVFGYFSNRIELGVVKTKCNPINLFTTKKKLGDPSCNFFL